MMAERPATEGARAYCYRCGNLHGDMDVCGKCDRELMAEREQRLAAQAEMRGRAEALSVIDERLRKMRTREHALSRGLAKVYDELLAARYEIAALASPAPAMPERAEGNRPLIDEYICGKCDGAFERWDAYLIHAKACCPEQVAAVADVVRAAERRLRREERAERVEGEREAGRRELAREAATRYLLEEQRLHQVAVKASTRGDDYHCDEADIEGSFARSVRQELEHFAEHGAWPESARLAALPAAPDAKGGS